ncbi:MAG: DUF3489 domain-containing protein [Alphaproteobacteria bacterium]|nr:DUF3489 domain-containing protein [Alphaproteobacteria bacterium]MDX5370125.1 DUF3489 domain-containing protein [Alphaproteobacteria bacterium]
MTADRTDKAATAKAKTQPARTRRVKTSGAEDATVSRPPSKFDRMVERLATPEGATIAELQQVTGWQPHSVRGALAGALKKKGHAIVSETVEGTRRYRIGAAR